MDTDLVAPATPTAAPVTPNDVTPTEPTAEPSIAEHEAQYGKKAQTVEPGGKDDLPPRVRHRAQKDVAKAEDAPRIQELTRKLREAERERDEWKTKHSSRPEPVASPAAPIPAAAPSAPAAEKPTGKPTWSQFEEQIGTKYDTWGAAQDAYVDARDDWRDAQVKQAQQATQREQSEQEKVNVYVERVREFAKQQPDFFDKTAAVAQDLDNAPQLLQTAVLLHDNGPEIAYYLATHPDTLVELSFLTDGKAVTNSSVALLQRRLTSYRMQAAATGSAPVVTPRQPAPRPPNPVRTGSMTPADDAPGDDASIAEHERYYGKKRR